MWLARLIIYFALSALLSCSISKQSPSDEAEINSSKCQNGTSNSVVGWAGVKRPADAATKSASVICDVPPFSLPIMPNEQNQSTYLHRDATVSKQTRKAGFTSCAIEADQFIEIAPALFSPPHLIGKGRVESASGACPAGCGLSEVWCTFSSAITTFSRVKASSPIPPDVDAKNPAALRTIISETENYELEAIPLDIAESLLRSKLAQDEQIETVKSVEFKNFSHRSQLIWLYVAIDAKVAGIRHTCRINKKFYLTLSPHPELFLQDAGSSVDCTSAATINFSQAVENILNKYIGNGGLLRAVLGDAKDWASWAQEDPEWQLLIGASLLQGYYCELDGRRYLCVARGWPLNAEGPVRSIRSELDRLRGKARKLASDYQSNQMPIPYGPVDKVHAELKRAEMDVLGKSHAYRSSCSQANFSYASGCRAKPPQDCQNTCPLDRNIWNEGDNTIFGGLSCLAGNNAMCDMVRRSQATNGNFYRSPDMVGDTFSSVGESPLSGDQFLGLMAYFVATKDAHAFRQFFAGVTLRKVWFPSDSNRIDWGYKFCDDNPEEHQCLMLGPEWFWANRVAEMLGVVDAIPLEERQPEVRYNYSPRQLIYQAAINPIGYRVHLVAIQIFLARSLMLAHPAYNDAAEVLYGRQPNNPFFQYLYYGPTALTLSEAEQKCASEPSDNHTEWAWQRSEYETAWFKDSMHWDCEFMYRLLAR